MRGFHHEKSIIFCPDHRYTSNRLHLYIIPPITNQAGILSATISLSKIANSCIVNNANIAIQNDNPTPLDATNNWWGMPSGASYDDFSAGDLVGENVVYTPHLTVMPILCDLSDADWIPFSEQDLQAIINQNIPSLRGIGFALIDIQWGSGVKFDLISTGAYGGITGEAFISILPSPDGQLMTLMLDTSRLPADPYLSQIVTCELMPLFLNSLQGVQNRHVAPSQDIFQMVVMDSSLMMRFTPLIETTPEPAPEVILTYDTSCLPPAIPTPEPTPIPPQDENEGLNLITIPPLEDEFLEVIAPPIENNVMLSQTTLLEIASYSCEPNTGGWCDMLQIGNVFTYVGYNQLFSIHRTITGIIEFEHILPSDISYPHNPSWGIVNSLERHYRLAFDCTVNSPQYHNISCYWDSKTDIYYYKPQLDSGSSQISPDGSKIARLTNASIHIWDLQTQTYAPLLLINETGFINVKWSDANNLYFTAYSDTDTTPEILSFNVSDNTIAVVLEIPNLVKYIFDVHLENLIYWSYDDSNQIISYILTYSGTGSWSFPSLHPVQLSPHNNTQFIISPPEEVGSFNSCVDLYDTTTMIISRIDCLYMGYGMDWVSGIDLTQPQVVTDKCLDMLQNPTPQDCINELALYGISADASGLTSAWASQASFARAWTLGELQEILIGVEKVADAFHLLTHEITNPQQSYEYNKEEAKAVFRLIIGDFFVLRVNNALNNGVWTYFKVQGDAQNDSCDGTRIASCTSNIAQAITFYDTISLGVTQYTMVHELGHRFNVRSDGGNGRTPNSLYGRMQSETLCEGIVTENGNVTDWCHPDNSPVVFGKSKVRLRTDNDRVEATENGWSPQLIDGIYYADDWRRGDRGWGSGPGTPANEEVNLVITNYQQHSFHIDDWGTPITTTYAQTQEEIDDIQLREREVDEASADMFLNWVYKKLNLSEGFTNLNWVKELCDSLNKPTPCEDSVYVPGDRRFAWMNVTMKEIFNQSGTSWRTE